MNRAAEVTLACSFSIKGVSVGEAAIIGAGVIHSLNSGGSVSGCPIFFDEEIPEQEKKVVAKKRKGKAPKEPKDSGASTTTAASDVVIHPDGSASGASDKEAPLAKKSKKNAAVPSADKPKKKSTKKNAKSKDLGGEQIDAQQPIMNFDEAY